MSVNLTQKDWILISAYLDKRLSDVNILKVESRLKTDSQFKQALIEIQYTRRMLRSLPQKRAPRNFTLSPQKVKTPIRRGFFQPVMSFVSATAALALMVIFASSRLFPMFGTAKSAAPMLAAAPEMASDSSMNAASESASDQPMIIQWYPEGSAPSGAPESTTYYGPGDGLGGAGGSGIGGGSGGGGDGTPTEEPMRTTDIQPTATPSVEAFTAAQPKTQPDPSTLILGVQEPGADNQVMTAENTQPLRGRPPLPSSTLWMIGLAALSLTCGTIALILRRR